MIEKYEYQWAKNKTEWLKREYMSFNHYYAWIKVQLQIIVYKLLTFVKSVYKKMFNKLHVTNSLKKWNLRRNFDHSKVRIMEKSW